VYRRHSIKMTSSRANSRGQAMEQVPLFLVPSSFEIRENELGLLQNLKLRPAQ
ncbi:hypothetical protein PanWU01x14_170180, partial [Parasponia andersonii]